MHFEENLLELPIGVFDSGMGGLTVLKQLSEVLPNESFIYLGDTARLPYGTKSQDTVVQYAKQMAQKLISKGIKCLVIACNTATTSALDALRQLYPQLPIIGVIEPGAIAAVTASKKQSILVLATETTVRSGVYQRTICRLEPKAQVAAKACGLFVALAEEGCIADEVTDAVLRKYLPPSQTLEQDCILLGCTHFPVLAVQIQKHQPGVTIVDSAIETAKAVKAELHQAKLISKTGSLGQISYLVTDLPERFARIGQIFLGKSISLASVELVSAGSGT